MNIRKKKIVSDTATTQEEYERENSIGNNHRAKMARSLNREEKEEEEETTKAWTHNGLAEMAIVQRVAKPRFFTWKQGRSDNKPLYSIVEGRRDSWN